MRTDAPLEIEDETLLWRTVSVGFAQRRKTIFNNLRQAPHDVALLIEERAAQAVCLMPPELNRSAAPKLALEEWLRLARVIEEAIP
jgi:16S rRNA A1518/A1519 N6-dimethyltransferase RsmA/KsgA/DIM1 with predicted DNA glycosylase/AP lyase activity